MELENKLLDTVREKCGIPSDNALSKKLGVTRALVSGWRLDRYAIPDERIAEMCAMADLDGPWWIAEIHAAKAQSRVERKLWRAMADRLSAAAAVVALVALSMPGLANAKTAQNQAVSGGLLTHSVYYVPRKTGTQPNAALEEPVHHIHIHQAQHLMTERLWQPPHHLKPELPVQSDRWHIGTHHVIELHGEKSV